MIGILSTDNIADLKPLGDRILVEVSPPSHKSYTAPVHSPQRRRVMMCALSTCSRCLSSKAHTFAHYNEASGVDCVFVHIRVKPCESDLAD